MSFKGLLVFVCRFPTMSVGFEVQSTFTPSAALPCFVCFDCECKEESLVSEQLAEISVFITSLFL